MADRTPHQFFIYWLTWVGFVLAMFSVLLQMNSVDGGFLTSYLADIGGPIWVYGIIRQRKVLFKKILPNTTALFSALFVFSVGTVWEICEAFDFSGTPLAITRGRFDYWDIVCYAGSLAFCYFADKYVETKYSTVAVNTSSGA